MTRKDVLSIGTPLLLSLLIVCVTSVSARLFHDGLERAEAAKIIGEVRSTQLACHVEEGGRNI